MRMRIDERGALHIERAGLWRRQDCPRATGNRYCGDWCPLFGEPEMEMQCNADRDDRCPFQPGLTQCHDGCIYREPTGRMLLALCSGRVLPGEIEDLRWPPEGG